MHGQRCNGEKLHGAQVRLLMYQYDILLDSRLPCRWYARFPLAATVEQPPPDHRTQHLLTPS